MVEFITENYEAFIDIEGATAEEGEEEGEIQAQAAFLRWGRKWGNLFVFRSH